MSSKALVLWLSFAVVGIGALFVGLDNLAVLLGATIGFGVLCIVIEAVTAANDTRREAAVARKLTALHRERQAREVAELLS
jgi:uncharacterized oligopeptide transporter (OPT) family protein